MNTGAAVVTPSSRSARAKDAIMRTAERLYAEHGFAHVSIRMIREAAGQRNKSAVQYHFSTREELVQAILSRHAAAVDGRRLPMVAALEDQDEVTQRDWITCAIVPAVEHHLDLGTPSWYARFLAQALVEPSLREDAARTTLSTPSFRRLERLRPPSLRHHPLSGRHAAMVRLLVVHLSAELEADLAAGRVPADTAESSWRELGDHLVTAVCGLGTALLR
ncbi:MAG: TetR/AcrR family transcriptional regulator [Nonomuraea sp.]|nr:TetR/AcrR family transcriptional regulator [Nonomuraea sp.]